MKPIVNAKEVLSSEIVQLITDFAKKELPDTKFDVYISTEFDKGEDGKSKLGSVEIKLILEV